MKKTFLAICSVLLVIASLFGFYAAGMGVRDCLDIKAYKEADAEEASVVEQLEEAIGLLKENEQAYLEGVKQYEDGVKQLADGEKQIAEGKQTLAAAKVAYSDGLAQYEAGKAQYAEGKVQFEEGKALLSENTAAYEEGKETLSKIEPLMPLIDTYIDIREAGLKNMPGFTDAQAWFVEKVKPMAADMGLELPDDVTDVPGYIQTMVTEGKAQLKEYEDGEAQLNAAAAQLADAEVQLADAEKQLADGKYQIADGEVQLADAEKQLEDGRKQLAEGKETMAQFEDGMEQVDGYTMICYKNEAIYRHNGDMAVPGPEQRLGEDYTWDMLDENGEVVFVDEHKYLDLDKCLEVCSSFRDSVDDHVADVTRELYSRLALYIMLVIAGICGLIGGICGITAAFSRNSKGVKAATVLGTIATILMITGNVFGIVTRYYGYTYPLRYPDAAGNDVFEYSGTLQLESLLVMLVVVIMFTLGAAAVKDRLEKQTTL